MNKDHIAPKKQAGYPTFTEGDTLRGAVGQYRSNFDVTHYDLSIDFNLKKRYIKGFPPG